MPFQNQPPNLLADLGRRARAGFVAALFGLALAACGGGGGGGGPAPSLLGEPDDDTNGNTTTTCTTPPSPNGSITISGRVTYDRVPTSASGGFVELDYDATSVEPARGVVVQALACDLSVMASTVTDADGNYSLVAGGDVPVMIRVRAQLLASSGATWNVRVLDNTSNDAQYVLDGTMLSTTQADESRDLHAASGWGGARYSATRAAAPFAILDSIYGAMAKIVAIDADVAFPALDVFWSTGNQLSSTEFNTDEGLLPASFFNGSAIYLLGRENQDTDEYDEHVILHEWGHYIQYRFSRDDSLGGAHADISHLDARVAFSEGFGNAWSALMTDDPVYVDTDGTRQSNGFEFSVESDAIPGYKGWFKEFSIQQIIYDIYDSADDGADAVTLGLAPIWQTLTGDLVDTDAFVTLFPFITELKQVAPSQQSAINALTSFHAIDPIVDALGTGEDNWAGLDAEFSGSEGTLDVYETLLLNATQNVCTTGVYGAYNGFGVYRYLSFTATTAGSYRLEVDALNDIVNAQPALAVWRNGTLIREGTAPATLQLGSGTYVIEVFDLRNIDGEPLGDSGVIDTTIDVCFAVSVTAS